MDRKYAIFDMDGTLVDSMGFWQFLGREVLVSKGVTEGLDEVLLRVRAMTITESAGLFLSAFHLPGTVEDLAAEMNRVMERHYREDIPLKQGVYEYLEQLRDAGVVMCVASATDGRLMKDCLQRLEVDEFFSFLLSCEEVGAGKDRPDVFLEAARRLRAEPEQIMVYEDAYHAAKTAKDAGFAVAAVYDDSGKAGWQELKAMADLVVCDWKTA